MAGLTNFRPCTQQTVEVGFVIVTQDCEGGMVGHPRPQAGCAAATRRVALDGS
jgi:hypothetical protein